jgi:iron complex outermembrane receptor protein
VSDRVKNWSVYAEAGYDLSAQLNLTVSGRYLHEKNQATFTRPIVSAAQTVQKKFIPAATLSYKLDDGNVYLRWARGFKTGGINLATAAAYYPRPQDGSVFGPETVDTFEAGYKQSLMGGTLQLTAAAFYNAYRDLQVDTRARPAFPQLTTAIINAKSARTWGAEASVLWRVSPPLTVGVNAGYLNAKYKDFRLTGSAALEDFDQSGLTMPKAPKWQLSFTADVDQPLNRNLRVVGNLLVAHVSEVIFQRSPIAGIIPDAIGPAYWLTNARIGLRTVDDRFGLALVADNVFNEGYYTFGQSAVTGVLAGWGSPRIVRAEASVKF